MENEANEAAKKAADEYDDPHLKALTDLGESFDKSIDSVTRKAAELDAKLEGVRKTAIDDAGKIRAEVEAGFETHSDQIKSLQKNRIRGAVGGATDPYRGLVEALSDEARKGISNIAVQPEDKGHHFGDPGFKKAADEWFRLSTQIQSKELSQTHGGKANQQLSQLNSAFYQFATSKALAESTTSLGAAWVPAPVASEMLRLVLDSSVIASRVRRVPMTSKTLALPDEATAVTINWVAEAGTLTATQPTLGQKTLTTNKLVGRCTASIEVVEDSSVAVLPYIQSIFAEQFGRELDFQIMEGTTPFTGVVGASGVNALATTASTTGADITYADLTAVFVAAGEASTRNDAVWVCSPAVFGKILGMVDSNGQPIVKFATVETAPMGTILGRPVLVSNKLSSYTVGSDATGNLYFGPPSALILGIRSDMRWDVSDQVNWGSYSLDMRLVMRPAYVAGVPAAWTKLTKIHND